DVERLRELAIAAHHEDATVADDAAGQAEKLVESWSLERAEEVARAFTVYFHLVNVAEEYHRIRSLRANERADRPLAGTVAQAVEEVARLHGDAQTKALLSRLEFRPVLTRSEEHTSELQSRENLVCRRLLEKKNLASPTIPPGAQLTTLSAPPLICADALSLLLPPPAHSSPPTTSGCPQSSAAEPRFHSPHQ